MPGSRTSSIFSLRDPTTDFSRTTGEGWRPSKNPAKDVHGAKFENLPWDAQTAFLREMESGTLGGASWGNGFAARFFELLRSHSMQGYYGSPRHGGNKNFVSYKMIGIDDFQTIGQNRYGA